MSDILLDIFKSILKGKNPFCSSFHEKVHKLKGRLKNAKKILNYSEEIKIYDELGQIYSEAKKWKKAIKCYQKELLLTRLQQPARKSTIYISLALAYFHLSKWNKGTEYAELALELAKEIGDSRLEGKVCQMLGNAFYAVGSRSQAICCYEKSRSMLEKLSEAFDKAPSPSSSVAEEKTLSLAKQLGDKQVEGIALSHLGLSYYQMDQPEEAIKHFEQSLLIAKEEGDIKQESSIYHLLGEIFYEKGYWKKAAELFEKGLHLAQDQGDLERECQSYENLANALYKLKEFDKALVCCEKQLALAKDLGAFATGSSIYLILGKILWGQHYFDQALEQFEKGLKIAQEMKSAHEESKAYFHLGFAYFNLGEWKKAIECFKKELFLVTGEVSDQKRACQIYSQIGDVYFKTKKWHKALDFYQRSLLIAKDWKDEEAANKAFIGIAKTYYELEEVAKANQFCEFLLNKIDLPPDPEKEPHTA